MLSNIIKSNTKALTKVLSNKKFHRQANSDKGKYKNYLIDLFPINSAYESVVVAMPKEIVPNDVTLDALNCVYQKDHSILPTLLRYLTHTDLLREAKDDLNEVNQKLQDLMDEEIKNLQIEQKMLREEIISKLSDKEVNVKQGEEVAKKSAKITKTASRIEEIELYKKDVRNILSGEKVISRTYSKEYYSILNDELTKIMEKKLKAYVKDDEVNVEKTYQSLNSKAEKIVTLKGAKLIASIVPIASFIFCPFVQFFVGEACQSPAASLYAVAIMLSVAIISLTISGVIGLANRHYEGNFVKEIQDYMEGPKHTDKATNTEDEKELELKEEPTIGNLIDFSDHHEIIEDELRPSAPPLENEKGIYPSLLTLQEELDSVIPFTTFNAISNVRENR